MKQFCEQLLQISCKSSEIAMSNNGSSIEIIAQSHGNLAVEVFYWDKKCKYNCKLYYTKRHCSPLKFIYSEKAKL